MFYVLISIIAGISIVISRIINSNLAKEIGILEGTSINYIVGLLFSFIFVVFSGEISNINNIDFKNIPFWAYLGGVTGVFIVGLSSYITPRMSAFYLTLIIFIGQLFTGIVIDYAASGNLSIGKLAGGLLVLLGLAYNLNLDKKQETENI